MASGGRRSHRVLGFLLFALYLALLLYVVFFAEFLGRTEHGQEDVRYNLTLFLEIRRFYQYRHVLGMRIFLLNTVGNVLAFMPLGFFVPFFRRRDRKGIVTVAICFLFSLVIECFQLYFHVGRFDVDDIFLNTMGGIAGYLFYVVYSAIRKGNRK